ncbi:TonB-dependent siderophore receptor [Breoghania corrubedonensis]|nr:TonB-dependent siderophore receptor [Breoghania corrubedonensis]
MSMVCNNKSLRGILSTTGLVGIAALSALAAPPGIAHAQRAKAIELETIVVTADGGEDPKGPVDGFVASRSTSGTKTNASILETPASVSVVTKDQVEQQGAQTVQEALRYSAGVAADIRAQDRYDIVPMRGFGGYQSFVQYLDGLRMLKGISFAQPTVDVRELERIEIFRGPASVLYGAVNPGGLVNLVSKRPTKETQHELELAVGYPWGVTGAFDTSGPVNDAETFLYRVSGFGYFKQSDMDDMNSQRYSISPSFTWLPSDDTKITLLANVTHEPESYYPSRLPADGTVYLKNASTHIPYDFNIADPDFDKFIRDSFRIGYEFEHQFDDVFTFRQNLRYSYMETEFRGFAPGTISGTTLGRTASAVDEELHTLAVDNQLEADFTTGMVEHKMLGGFDYQWSEANRLFGAAGTTSIDILDPDYSGTIATPAFRTDVDQHTQQAGTYLQEQARIGKLALTLGGRLDWYSQKTETLTIASGDLNTQNQQDTAFTWRAGAAYLFDSGFAPYVSYATSFEVPAGVAVGNVALDPVTGRQYEIGVKYQPAGYDSFLMISAFDLTQNNAVTSDTSNSGYYRKIGRVNSRGIEVTGKASFDNGWDLTGSYTFVDAEIRKDLVTKTNVGNTPATIPQHIASIWAHYTFQSGKLEGLGLGAGARYTGESWGNDENEFKVKDFTLFDAALDYDLGKLDDQLEGTTFRFNVQNVLDTEYVSSCSASNACFYGTGRTFLASLKYKW